MWKVLGVAGRPLGVLSCEKEAWPARAPSAPCGLCSVMGLGYIHVALKEHTTYAGVWQERVGLRQGVTYRAECEEGLCR